MFTSLYSVQEGIRALNPQDHQNKQGKCLFLPQLESFMLALVNSQEANEIVGSGYIAVDIYFCLYKPKYLNKSGSPCVSWESVVPPAWRDILITFWNNKAALVAIPSL